MSKSKHTPTPWDFCKAKTPVDGEFDFGIYATVNGHPNCVIAETFGRVASDIRPDAEANAAFIVRAVNAHEDLFEAAQLYDQTYASTQTNPTAAQEARVINAMRAAIAKATGGTP